MNSKDIKDKYIEFFLKSPRNHKKIPEAPIVLQDDPTTLFNSSGMQQLIPYLMGEKHPLGKRLVDSQGCLRTVDIDEVGDNRHLTYFEMLGNWSLGDYFKKEQITWFFEFLTKVLGLDEKRIYVSIFEGTKDVPKDEKSHEIWKELGVPDERIGFYGVDKNWWSRSGTPDQMPNGEIGGPDTEVFYEFPDIKHNKKFGEKCHPNCDCGRFLEIGNSVFIQYKKENEKLVELPEKNVDFGGGLERLAAAVQDKSDIFLTDIYKEEVSKIEKLTGKKYEEHKKNFRIIVDHLRASEKIIDFDIEPSNKMQGYVLRMLIRRLVLKLRSLKEDVSPGDVKSLSQGKTSVVLEKEAAKFLRLLEKGLKEVEKIKTIDGKKAFDLYQSFGFPVEITKEIFKEKGQKIDEKELEKEFKKHQERSKNLEKSVFKGGLADKGEDTIKMHTATHLLHWALREILGENVRQEGSNITNERLRFDFSNPNKLSEEEIKKVEDLINEKIKEGLPVTKTIEDKKEALDSGAVAFFKQKYPDKVSVYTIGDFSKELCGGPHVKNTKEIGRVRIKKQEKIGSNLIRIYADLA